MKKDSFLVARLWWWAVAATFVVVVSPLATTNGFMVVTVYAVGSGRTYHNIDNGHPHKKQSPNGHHRSTGWFFSVSFNLPLVRP